MACVMRFAPCLLLAASLGLALPPAFRADLPQQRSWKSLTRQLTWHDMSAELRHRLCHSVHHSAAAVGLPVCGHRAESALRHSLVRCPGGAPDQAHAAALPEPGREQGSRIREAARQVWYAARPGTHYSVVTHPKLRWHAFRQVATFSAALKRQLGCSTNSSIIQLVW